MTPKECEVLLDFTLNVSSRMMECGAEAWRTENTMARIFRAYGLYVQDTHTMATQTAATIKDSAGRHYHATRAILPEKTGTDLERLEAINAAARWICANPPSVWDLPDRPEETLRPWRKREFFGYLLGSGVFALFFGGGVAEGLLSALIGAAIYGMNSIPYLRKQNRIIYTFFACLISGLLAEFFAFLLPGVRADIIMIGDVMLFIPGLALVNGARELFYSDILTGLYRIVEALLIAGAIVLGFAVSLLIGGMGI